jgi:hypothetical protein
VIEGGRGQRWTGGGRRCGGAARQQTRPEGDDEEAVGYND